MLQLTDIPPSFWALIDRLVNFGNHKTYLGFCLYGLSPLLSLICIDVSASIVVVYLKMLILIRNHKYFPPDSK